MDPKQNLHRARRGPQQLGAQSPFGHPRIIVYNNGYNYGHTRNHAERARVVTPQLTAQRNSVDMKAQGES